MSQHHSTGNSSNKAAAAAADFFARVEKLESPSRTVPSLPLHRVKSPRARPLGSGGGGGSTSSSASNKERRRSSSRAAAAVAGAYRQVIATYDFSPNDGAAGQLALRKGDLVLVTDESEAAHGWLEGVVADRQGWFPANRVERIRQRPLLVALYDLEPKKSGYLGFRAGDVITLRQTFPSWYEGELDGVIGLVPVTYVKPLMPLLPTADDAAVAQLSARSAADEPTAAAVAAPALGSPSTSRGRRAGAVSPRTGRVYHSSHLPPTPFLKVRIVRGRRLPMAAAAGEGGVAVAPDTYVDVAVGDVSAASDVARRSTAPEWHASFFVPAAGCSLLTEHMKVHVSQVRGDPGGGGDTLLGSLSIPLQYFRERRTRAAWFPLQTRAPRGEVRLRLLYEVDGGTLNVEVVEGRGFIDSAGPNVYASPYVTCDVGEFRDRTSASQSVAAPHWNHKMRIPAARARDDLVVTVFDASDTRPRAADATVRQGFIGDAVLPLSLLVPGQAVDAWITLTAREINTPNGDVFLSVDWVE